MTVEKLPSGSYRIRIREKNVRCSITVDHKPTSAEIANLVAREMEKKKHLDSVSLSYAAENYIDSKRNVLSPATIRSYVSMVKRIPDGLLQKDIYEITKQDMQKFVNDYAANHAPKSVRDLYGLVAAILLFYDIHLPTPRLPQKEAKEPYIPSKEDVEKLFEAIKGSEYECAILLAGMGLRMSEICAVTSKDITDGNVLHINKVKVFDEHGKWVIKKFTKTEKSTRTIVLPDRIVDLIMSRGYAYQGVPVNCNKYLEKVEKELGLPHFSPHKLRHFFASYLHQLGYSDKQIQDMGGWKTDGVMKTVYRHAMEMDKAKSKASSDIGNLM